MQGEKLVVNDRKWLTDIVQHWPDGGPSDRPTALDVLFYDPEDHDQWVGNFWIPFDTADLSRDRGHTLFRDADTRSWRDREGRYWWIRNYRPGAAGPRESGDRLPDGILSFQRMDSDGTVTSRVVAELPPVGHLSDDELESFLPGDTGRETVPRLSDAGPAVSQ